METPYIAQGRVYNTQDSLRIELSYINDLGPNVASVKIKYIKPNSSTINEWNALHNPASKIIYYDLPQGTFLDPPGEWRFWVFITYSDNRVAPGDVFKTTIYKEGVE